MPELQLRAGKISWSSHGSEQRPALLLIHSLGTARELFAAQLCALQPQYRIVAYDLRGHGQSTAMEGDYAIADLAADALAVLDAAGVERAHVLGLSIGGVIALQLALQEPARVASLIIANSAARVGTPELWSARIAQIRAQGLAPAVDQVLPRWFSAAFRAAQPQVALRYAELLQATSVSGYTGCCAALRDADLRSAVAAIRTPTLVLAGAHDLATPPADGEQLAKQIPDAQYAVLDAAHLSAVEQPEAFTRAVREFLADGSPGADDARSAGMRVRRRMLGDAHVDRASGHPFTRDFQDWITRCAWGEIWTRPGLVPRERRMLVIATLIALGHWDELRMHARAALEQGDLGEAELREILLQQAVYCGVPAANHAFKVVQELLDELRPAQETSS